MKERSFDEMIAYFNRRVSEMDIAQDYKMELLGMVTAIGYKHEKTVQPRKGKWIPVQISIAHPPYHCSRCFGNTPMVETGCLMNRHLEAQLTSFCPNCGADMRGEEE